MRLRHLCLLAVLTAALLLAGCNSGGSQHFSADSVPFSFSYPAGWTLTRTPPGDGGAGMPLQAVTAALKEPYDQATVSQYKLKKQIPEGERAYRLEVDRIVGRLAREAGGSTSEADEVEFAGLPGYQYTITYSAGRQKLENRMTFLFRGSTQLLIACQSAPERREQLNDGCQQILDSLKLDQTN